MTKKQIARAANLICAYRQTDKKYNYGKSDLTPQWVVENIFSKPCVHCGETDWRKIGCNRIDDSKPHTMDNVEPCCCNCNRKLPRPNARGCRIPNEERKVYIFLEELKRNIGIYKSVASAYVY